MSLRDLLFFLTGAAFFHTLGHILLPLYIKMPLDLGFMTFSTAMNSGTIIVSALVTAILFFMACRSKR